MSISTRLYLWFFELNVHFTRTTLSMQAFCYICILNKKCREHFHRSLHSYLYGWYVPVSYFALQLYRNGLSYSSFIHACYLNFSFETVTVTYPAYAVSRQFLWNILHTRSTGTNYSKERKVTSSVSVVMFTVSTSWPRRALRAAWGRASSSGGAAVRGRRTTRLASFR